MRARVGWFFGLLLLLSLGDSYVAAQPLPPTPAPAAIIPQPDAAGPDPAAVPSAPLYRATVEGLRLFVVQPDTGQILRRFRLPKPPRSVLQVGAVFYVAHDDSFSVLAVDSGRKHVIQTFFTGWTWALKGPLLVLSSSSGTQQTYDLHAPEDPQQIYSSPDEITCFKNLRLGQSHLLQGNDAEAIECFQKAYALRPYSLALLEGARAQDRLGRFSDALVAYRRFRALTSDATPEQVAEVDGAIRRLAAKVPAPVQTTPRQTNGHGLVIAGTTFLTLFAVHAIVGVAFIVSEKSRGPCRGDLCGVGSAIGGGMLGGAGVVFGIPGAILLGVGLSR